MTARPVPRTCTEIGADGSPVGSKRTSDGTIDWRRILAEDDPEAGAGCSRTLAEYREVAAWVLLGDPGLGKTTEFKAEGRRDGCHYVTARDFLTFDVDGRPQWRDTTLFIDGLDEVRAGSPDGRTPLNRIRAKLDTLGRPRFRLSCREADWFGANDRTHLKTVSRDGEVKTLRLDPLSRDGIRELLRHHAGIDDVKCFVEMAHERGIGTLLANPQSLGMLAEAVSAGMWPKTRTETFELACGRLVREFNCEHRLASPGDPPASDLLDAAGRLCALQLICGLEGAALDEDAADDLSYPVPERFGPDTTPLRRVLFRRLFTEATCGRRRPIHRRVAEYLAARHLARLIGEGLSVHRVLALVTGEDGGVVTPLRGLAAWLAACCPGARQEMVERDPVGVAAYGDAGAFTREEKHQLLERLRSSEQSIAARLFAPLSSPSMAPGVPEYLTGRLCTPLVDPGMSPALREHLTDPRRDDEHQSFVVFLLRVLENAPPLPELGEVYRNLAADEERWPGVRTRAAACFAESVLVAPDRFRDVARQFLNELRSGSIRDDGKELSGTLLQILYPTFIKPDEVFDGLRITDFGSEPAKAEREWTQRERNRRRGREQVFDEQRRFFREREEALRNNRCPPGALNMIAEASWGCYTNIQGNDGRERLQALLEEDMLVEAAMDGLRGAIHRDDLPAAADVFALRRDNQRHLLAYPVVVGLDLLSPDERSRLDDWQVQSAVASYLASPPPSPEPKWLRPLLAARPCVAAEEIIRFAMMALRRGEPRIPFVSEMLADENLSAVARAAGPRLLRSFPVRAPNHLSGLLRELLWWGIENSEASVMGPIVAAKLRAKSMTLAQRAHWLAAQLVLTPEPTGSLGHKHGDAIADVADFAKKHENAMTGFCRFLEHPPDRWALLNRLPSASLGRLALRLGIGCYPLTGSRSYVEVGEPNLARVLIPDLVRVLVEALGTRADDDAASALMELAGRPDFEAWQPMISRVRQQQRVLRRDASDRRPDLDAARESLERRQPANTADLAALTVEILNELGTTIRNGSTNDWRQYWMDWDQGSNRQPSTPLHEDDCRDRLLSDLQRELSQWKIEAVPEGRYVDEKRSDIRVSFGGFNVPIEVKKSNQRGLWRALRHQLIAKYTGDPGAAGYGIYLVLWFGSQHCQNPEAGVRPRSGLDLAERLRGTLSEEEARLVSICVIDVARR